MRRILVLVIVAACGGTSTIPPGDQTYTPPPMPQDGGGKPSGATDVMCGAAADCDYWFCQCSDGAVVNAALCVNSYCMAASSACPDACGYFHHGSWTGDASGGPGSITHTCGSFGSQDPTCDACFRTSCCDPGTACANSPACLDLWDCVVGCGSSADCVASCEADKPDGRAPYEALQGCLVDHCSSQCGGGS
jgi:hypothetical protein